MKALKILLDKGEMPSDVVLMADKMYLRKGTGLRYSYGGYVGADEDGSLYTVYKCSCADDARSSKTFSICCKILLKCESGR